MHLENTGIVVSDVKHQMSIDGALGASGSSLDRTDELRQLLVAIGLTDARQEASRDKAAKIGQVFSYLEVIHAQLRSYSKKRELVLVDSGAGNCFLSYVVYCFYTRLERRPVRIHCVDSNALLMESNRQLARSLGFDRMAFHGCDIADYQHVGRPDAVYSLHACDLATDKTLHLGVRTEARHIFSVSCCQHTMSRGLRRNPYSGITRYQVLRDRLAYMVGDSLRALLLEMNGYEVDILQFASSRYTDKNVMLRAKKGQTKGQHQLSDQYAALRDAFRLRPALEQYLCQASEGTEAAGSGVGFRRNGA